MRWRSCCGKSNRHVSVPARRRLRLTSEHPVPRRRVETLWAMAAALAAGQQSGSTADAPLPVLLASLAEGSEGETASFFQTAATLPGRERRSLGRTWPGRCRSLRLTSGHCPPSAERCGAMKRLSAGQRSWPPAAGRLRPPTGAKTTEEEKQITALCFSTAALIVILLI